MVKKSCSMLENYRDRFVHGVMGGMEEWTKDHSNKRKGDSVDKNTVEVNGEQVIVPNPSLSQQVQDLLFRVHGWSTKTIFLTSDQIFELETLPKSVAVIGLGVIGVELGQALARLGVEVHGISLDKALGGISSPKIQDYTLKAMKEEFSSITIGSARSTGSR